MKIMTLCEKCREEMKTAGFRKVDRIPMKQATTKIKDKCEGSGCSQRVGLGLYMVVGRR